MLTYTKTPDSSVAEIVVDGRISDEEMNAALAAMKADLDKGGPGGGKLKLLQDVRAIQGMEPAAFFKDPRFGIAMAKGVSHVALVTDAPWLKVMAETFNFVAPYKIKVFERDRLEEARHWITAAA